MSKQVLSIEQMWHLGELIPLKSVYDVDFIWCGKGEGIEHKKYNYQLYCSKTADANPLCDNVYPAYTLQDILDLLPNVIIPIEINPVKYELRIKRMVFRGGRIMYAVIYEEQDCINWYVLYSDSSLIDAAYEMLLWCIEHSYIIRKEEKR